MRVAVISDIHGNLTALEAVLADLRQTSPDLVLHGGDLADNGSHPVEVVDRIRDLGWQGVGGNTDEMLYNPGSLPSFAAESAAMKPLLPLIEEMAAATRAALGEERLAWLRRLPHSHISPSLALVHASPGSLWRAPPESAGDAELEEVYAGLSQPVVVYGHIHRPYIRRVRSDLTVVNTGSVSLSYDGDRRASYLLLDGLTPSIRRIEYNVEKEVQALSSCALPHAGWVARILIAGYFQMP